MSDQFIPDPPAEFIPDPPTSKSAPKAQEPAKSSVVASLNAPFRAAAQGLTLGAADEIAGGVGAALGKLGEAVGLGAPESFKDRYSRIRRQYLEQDAESATASPVGTAAGTVLSMLAPTGAIGSAVTTAGKIATAGGIGAASGFLGSDGSAVERLPGAAVGLGLGLAGGAVAAGKGPELAKKAMEIARDPVGSLVRLPGGRGAVIGGGVGMLTGEPQLGAAIGTGVELAGRGVVAAGKGAVAGVRAARPLIDRLKDRIAQSRAQATAPAPAEAPVVAPEPAAAPTSEAPASTSATPGWKSSIPNSSADSWASHKQGRPKIVPDSTEHPIQSESGKALQETGRTYTAREDKALKLLEDSGGSVKVKDFGGKRDELRDGMLKLTYRGLAHFDDATKTFKIGKPSEGASLEHFTKRLRGGAKPADVPAADAGWSEPVFRHETAEKVANEARKSGMQASANGNFGPGVYLHAPESKWSWRGGEPDTKVLPVSIRSKNTLVADSLDEFDRKIIELGGLPGDTANMGKFLQSKGYDAMKVRYDQNRTDVVVFDPANVRVVDR